MSTRHVRWLLAELPVLVAGGVLSLDAAARLEAHFTSRPGPRRRWLALGLGVLGAALIGSGLAMVLAHNWDQLARPARLAISLALLVVAQTLSGFSLLRRAGSTPWGEATATGLVFALGASIGLITQTYHVDMDFEEFVGLWTLLSLPVVYIQGSRVAASLACAGIAWTALAGEWPVDDAVVFWGLALLMLPFMYRAHRDSRVLSLPVLPLWTAALTLALAGLAFAPFRDGSLSVSYLTGLYTGMFALGSLSEPTSAAPWRRPLWLVGAACACVTATVYSFSEPWPSDAQFSIETPAIRLVTVFAVSVLGLVAAAIAGTRAARGGRWVSMLFCGLPAFALLGLGALAVGMDELVPALLMSAWMLAAGLTALVTGSRRGEIGTANVGLALIAALAVVRFFDFDISLVGRGLAFVAVGAAFLVLNVVLQRVRAGRTS